MNREDIVNKAYDVWGENNEWFYKDMINFTLKENPVHALTILVNSYNNQVCNGGHVQYLDNGYADGVGGYYIDHPTTEMHDLMLSLMDRFGFSEESAYYIMSMFSISEFSVCWECGGTGYVGYVNDDGEEEEHECDACGGMGDVEDPSLNCDGDLIDNMYYKINDAWMEKFDAWLLTQGE